MLCVQYVQGVQCVQCVQCSVFDVLQRSAETTIVPLDGLTLDQESFCLIKPDHITEDPVEKSTVFSLVWTVNYTM